MSKKGFTLVEILIVVIILGILAAIVVPQFADASDDAKLSNLKSNLQAVRAQLELYRLQHSGNYPTNASQLTTRTNAAGTEMAAGDAVADFPCGPYLQQVPANPFATVDEATAASFADFGWTYVQADGSIHASTAGYENY